MPIKLTNKIKKQLVEMLPQLVYPQTASNTNSVENQINMIMMIFFNVLSYSTLVHSNWNWGIKKLIKYMF